jgi:hypothetical protein
MGDLTISWLGGNCPVQAEGEINGKPFYFRARGESWSLSIGGEPVGNPEWAHFEWFGEWPDAGWMTEEQAEAFLRRAAARYAEGKPGGRLEDDPERVAQSRRRLKELFDAPVAPPTERAGSEG